MNTYTTYWNEADKLELTPDKSETAGSLSLALALNMLEYSEAMV